MIFLNDKKKDEKITTKEEGDWIELKFYKVIHLYVLKLH